MGTLALPDAVEQWSLTTLREKLIKIDAKIVRHGRYEAKYFQVQAPKESPMTTQDRACTSPIWYTPSN